MLAVSCRGKYPPLWQHYLRAELLNGHISIRYISMDVGNICEQCDTGCGACTGSGSCTGCTDNTYLHNGACVDACPSGFIESLTTMECVSCDAGCAECEGTTSNCTSCKEDTSHYFKQPNENSCKTTCPQYYFK